MAQDGNSYIVSLKSPHLHWGEDRNPTNRDIVFGEGYIPIPRKYAKEYRIYNSNYANKLGYNLFYASSEDGFLKDVILLAQGSSKAGDIYAKQFSVQGDLQMIGNWYKHCKAVEQDSVQVLWTSETSILLKLIHHHSH